MHENEASAVLFILLQQLQEQALRDPLTGLFNRRYLFYKLDELLNTSEEGNTKFCVAFIDINNFKDINTKYGHLYGDRLLTKFSDLLRKYLNIDNYAVRYGGDEFVIIFPKTRIQEVESYIEHLKSVTKAELKLTLTVGMVASDNRKEIPTIEDLLQQVDAAFYKVKHLK